MDKILLESVDESLYGTDTTALYKRLKKGDTFRAIQINQRRLPDLYKKFLQYHPNGYIFWCRSQMGSGKTFQIRKIIRYYNMEATRSNKELRILIITPRRSFAHYICNVLQGFFHYQRVKKPYSYVQYPKLVVQLQSLKHFNDIRWDTYSVKGYSLLIMDEIHSIVQELFSNLFTAADNRYCIHIFIKILRAIPRWLCFDAHLSVDLINMLSSIISDKGSSMSRICLINSFCSSDHKLILFRKCLYNNTTTNILKRKLMASSEFECYKPFLCAQRIRNIVVNIDYDKVEKIFRKIYLRDFITSSDEDDILVELFNDLRQGNKVCVTTSTKKQALKLNKLLKSCGFKPKLLTGESSEYDKNRFVKNADSYLHGCSLFIYTTAFQVGIDVSSRVPYFDIHYVFIECSEYVASPAALVQAIGRIRNIKKNLYKVCVIENVKRQCTAARLDDLRPLNRDVILPCGKSDKPVFKDLIDFHFKEKYVSQNVNLFVNLFLRLLSHKAKPYVKHIDGGIQSLESVVNFASYQYSVKHYEEFIESFILRYSNEIMEYLDKYVQNIWNKLESETVFVSTIVNNFHAFIRLPNNMCRAECLMKICEFTNHAIGFLYSFLLTNLSDNNHLLRCYFEQQIKLFYEKCTIEDLSRFKTLFDKFINCCILKKGFTKFSIHEQHFTNMINECRNDILLVYSKFVSSIISISDSPRKLFLSMMSKLLHVYIRSNTADLSTLYSYMKIINIPKWVMYNASQTISI